MALQVIGAGVGRTGTYSLKLALEQLGLGPCHHMEEVVHDPHHHVPLWSAAIRGNADWEAAYTGYHSAVDWPTAAFWRELGAAYPQARFILTIRNPDRWYESFSATIFELMASMDHAPAQARPFLEMGVGVTTKTGFRVKGTRDEIIKAFNTHNDAVRDSFPTERLLVYEVSQGWEPLCRFVGKPVPDMPFPMTNGREDFWDRIKRPAP